MPAQPTIFNEFLTIEDIEELYQENVNANFGYLLNGKIVNSITKDKQYTGKTIDLPKAMGIQVNSFTFSPYQAGSGDPSPDNIRPIYGHDSFSATLSGSTSKIITANSTATHYGGTVDAMKGVGSEDWGFISFDGTEKWYTFGQGVALSNWVTNSALHVSTTDIGNLCNEATYTKNDINTIPQKGFFTDHNMNNVIWIVFSGYNLNEWKLYLEQQATAGHPVTVCYKLATSTSFRVTPAQDWTNESYNSVVTDLDSVTITTYKRGFFQ